MRIGVAGTALLVFGACGKDKPKYKPPPEEKMAISAKQVMPPSEHWQIDVETSPGAEVYCVSPPNSNGTAACDTVIADAQGKARLTSNSTCCGPHGQVMVTGHVDTGHALAFGDVIVDVSSGQVFYDDSIHPLEGTCVDHACHYTIGPGSIVFDKLRPAPRSRSPVSASPPPPTARRP